MRLQFTLAGVSPILMHNGAAGLDTRSALSREIAAITKKRGGNRTDVDDERLRELECLRSLYFDADKRPTLPEAALRAVIEAGARKTKQGSGVREGLMIESAAFRYDVKRYGQTLQDLSKETQFTAPVVVSRQRILRTRGEVRPPVVGGRRGRCRPGAGGPGQAAGMVGGGRPARRARRLAAGKERTVREVRRRGGDRAAGRRLSAGSGG